MSVNESVDQSYSSSEGNTSLKQSTRLPKGVSRDLSLKIGKKESFSQLNEKATTTTPAEKTLNGYTIKQIVDEIKKQK